MSESSPPTGPSLPADRHELATLRVLLSLPPEVLQGFAPQQPPEHVDRYLRQASKAELDWLLVDVLHQLRLRNVNRHQHNGRAGR
ncbi:hypothetical protein ACERK3_01470 [Phycisphaerales bacterium AB-hyl4]|uniref:Uncharacterized protein n=1 Tax=Natronomicrosphaera hydrolytica TaxID=3242702 RepID=A0ABV4U278_9BACT